jgi:hypothetical protein
MPTGSGFGVAKNSHSGRLAAFAESKPTGRPPLYTSKASSGSDIWSVEKQTPTARVRELSTSSDAQVQTCATLSQYGISHGPTQTTLREVGLPTEVLPRPGGRAGCVPAPHRAMTGCAAPTVPLVSRLAQFRISSRCCARCISAMAQCGRDEARRRCRCLSYAWRRWRGLAARWQPHLRRFF